jgi:hypothetical protein
VSQLSLLGRWRGRARSPRASAAPMTTRFRRRERHSIISALFQDTYLARLPPHHRMGPSLWERWRRQLGHSRQSSGRRRRHGNGSVEGRIDGRRFINGQRRKLPRISLDATRRHGGSRRPCRRTSRNLCRLSLRGWTHYCGMGPHGHGRRGAHLGRRSRRATTGCRTADRLPDADYWLETHPSNCDFRRCPNDRRLRNKPAGPN